LSQPNPNIGVNVYFLPVAGRPLGFYYNANVYTRFVHPNHLGSWTMMTDRLGGV